MSILVFIEHKSGALNKTSLEAIVAGQKLAGDTGQKVSAVVLGLSCAGERDCRLRSRKVISVETTSLPTTRPMLTRPRSSRLCARRILNTYSCRIRIRRATLPPKVAARFQKGLIGDCIRMNVEGDKRVFTRRIFLGKLDADVVSDGEPPNFVTFQSGAFRGDQAVKGSGAPVESMSVEVGEVRMKPEAPFQEAKQAVDLSKADVIVAVGRGIKSKDNLALAEKLAEVLGGDLAASRPIATRNGCQLIGRLDRPARRSRRSFTSRLASQARFSTWSA